MPPGLIALTALAVALGGCGVSTPAYLARPADASAKVPALAYQGVAGQTKTYRPVGPRDWEEINRRVSPQR